MNNNGSSFVYIDSKDRIYGTSNEFTVNVVDLNPNSEKDVSVNLLSINRSWYPVNNNNNSFVLTGATGGTTNYTATLTNGNYTSAAFLSHLDTVLDNLSFGVTATTFTEAISTITGKLTITASPSQTFSITSNTRNYKYLGMNALTTVASNASGVWTSPNVIDLAGTSYIDVMTNLPLASTNTHDQDKGLLCRVYPNADFLGQIVYTSESFDSVKLLTDRINNVSFRLEDEFGDTLELNGTDWAFTLEVIDRPRKI